jgi:hypothetical protein
MLLFPGFEYEFRPNELTKGGVVRSFNGDGEHRPTA